MHNYLSAEDFFIRLRQIFVITIRAVQNSFLTPTTVFTPKCLLLISFIYLLLQIQEKNDLLGSQEHKEYDFLTFYLLLLLLYSLISPFKINLVKTLLLSLLFKRSYSDRWSCGRELCTFKIDDLLMREFDTETVLPFKNALFI